jgi:hypothetical protein
VRHRLDGHHTLGLGLLSLIETLNLGIEPDGEVGRFDKGPGQILVPVLSIALAFFLVIADLLTADTVLASGSDFYFQTFLLSVSLSRTGGSKVGSRLHK